MNQAYKVTRTIDSREQPWMRDDDVIAHGEVVYKYTGCTYGCIGAGVAVSRQPDKTPFFEIPRDAIEPIPALDDAEEL